MLPNWARKRWGRFKSEQFTHYLISGLFKKKDKYDIEKEKKAEEEILENSEISGEEHACIKQALV